MQPYQPMRLFAACGAPTTPTQASRSSRRQVLLSRILAAELQRAPGDTVRVGIAVPKT